MKMSYILGENYINSYEVIILIFCERLISIHYISIITCILKDHVLFVYFTHHIPHRIQRQWKEQPHTEEPSKDENIVFIPAI